MKKQVLFKLFVLLLVFNGLQGIAQDKFLMQYKFQKGKSYEYINILNLSTVQSAMGQEMKNNNDINAKSEWKVEELTKEGNAIIFQVLKEMTVKSSGVKDTSFTVKEDKNRKKITYSKTGKVIAEEVIDKEKNNLVESTKEFAKIFVLPGKEIKIGEKWTDNSTDTIKGGGNPLALIMNIETEYTLSGIEKKDGYDYVKVNVSAKVTINGKGNQMGMDMILEGNGKNVGFFYFEPKQSIVVYSEIQSEIDMNLVISGQQNITMPITQSIKSVTKLIEKK